MQNWYDLNQGFSTGGPWPTGGPRRCRGKICFIMILLSSSHNSKGQWATSIWRCQKWAMGSTRLRNTVIGDVVQTTDNNTNLSLYFHPSIPFYLSILLSPFYLSTLLSHLYLSILLFPSVVCTIFSRCYVLFIPVSSYAWFESRRKVAAESFITFRIERFFHLE